MNVCLQRSKLYNQIPVAYLVCNGSPPIDDSQPALMTFREVETLFHEFGHGCVTLLYFATTFCVCFDHLMLILSLTFNV